PAVPCRTCGSQQSESGIILERGQQLRLARVALTACATPQVHLKPPVSETLGTNYAEPATVCYLLAFISRRVGPAEDDIHTATGHSGYHRDGTEPRRAND